MPRVVRVLPDVAAVAKEFDYSLPDSEPGVQVGDMVRIDLHGRRIGGWIVEVGSEPPDGVVVRDVSKVRGRGPDAAVVGLCRWAAWRWVGPVSHFLRTASPDRVVTSLPPGAPAWAGGDAEPSQVTTAFAGSASVLRMAPSADRTPVVEAAARRGTSIVLVPSVQDVARLADRLRRRGVPVAPMPDGWRDAAAGGRVVIGTRAAVFAPAPGLASIVVLDAHDERYRSEASPTWSAVTVARERASRADVPCVLVSPCPTVDMVHETSVLTTEQATERDGWARVEIVDRRADDPRTGLWSERVVAAIRSEARIVFVLNRIGRARVLACRKCNAVTTCETCTSNVAEGDGGELVCGRCGTVRPRACQACGAGSLRVLRIGVSRAREELEALADRPVGEVTASTELMPDTELVIGTEAVLHRAAGATRPGAVVFVDFDQHLLAPRATAAEDAVALIARAARLVGDRRSGGRVLVQTRQPEHPVLQAAARATPDLVLETERNVRAALRWPPYCALAELSGDASGELVASLADAVEVTGPSADGRWLLRAETVDGLCDALAAAPRPSGRLRIAVQ